MPANAFKIETERLTLIEFSPTMAQTFFDLNNDPEVVKYTGDPPFESVESAAQFLANYSEYEKSGFGRWAVISKSTNEMMGWCGLKRHENGEVDLGFRFFRKDWNQGYATEASIACISYAFHTLKLPYLIGRVMHENLASRRVLQKLGMQYWKEITCEAHPAMCYRLDAPQ